MVASEISTTLAARGTARLIARLIEGDPIAWSILGGTVAIIIVFFVVRKAWNVGRNEESAVADEGGVDEQRRP